MGNYTFLILDEFNLEYMRAANRIYLIHELIKNQGLSGLRIETANQKIKATLYNEGDLHDEPGTHEEEIQQLLTITINNSNYKLCFLNYGLIEE